MQADEGVVAEVSKATCHYITILVMFVYACACATEVGVQEWDYTSDVHVIWKWEVTVQRKNFAGLNFRKFHEFSVIREIISTKFLTRA